MHGNNTIKTCNQLMFLSITKWLQKAWKLYFIVHLIPIVLYKRKEFKQNTLKVIANFILGNLKSYAFICANAAFSPVMFCRINKTQIAPLTTYLGAVLITGGVFFEPRGRVEELAIWVLPKFLETAWNYFKKRNGFKKEIPGFLTVLFALSVGVFCELYNSNKSGVKSKYQIIGRKLIGDDVDISSVIS